MTATAKAYKGMGMEGSIARWYDRTTRKDMPEFRALAARIAGVLPSGSRILEVAPGPGFLSIELAKRGFRVQGVDVSETFVELACRNAASEGVEAAFELGSAAALPVGDGKFDFVVCRAAFKNFTEPVKALLEMRRVLRPGATALLIDMRRDVSIAEIARYVNGLGVGSLNRWFMMMVFRRMLIKRAYSVAEIRRMLQETGWEEPEIEITAVGFEAWMSR